MQERKQISHIAAGLMIAGLIIVLSLILSAMGAGGTMGRGSHAFLIIVGGLIYFIYQYGRANNYSKGFGDLFAYGFKTTSIFTLVFIVFVIIFTLLDPESKNKFLEITRAEMEKQSKTTDDDLDKYIGFLDKYYLLVLVGGTLLAYLVIGAIGSLIGAAVTKKRPHNPLEQFNT
jgi:hypothetical protein